MFKKTTPKKVIPQINQFPHCDQRVLHAPGECKYCDAHPLWQELRQAWGIAFTGYLPEDKELPCPSDNARGLNGAHVWGGNRPTESIVGAPNATAMPVSGQRTITFKCVHDTKGEGKCHMHPLGCPNYTPAIAYTVSLVGAK